jgi:hypothetical protein
MSQNHQEKKRPPVEPPPDKRPPVKPPPDDQPPEKAPPGEPPPDKEGPPRRSPCRPLPSRSPPTGHPAGAASRQSITALPEHTLVQVDTNLSALPNGVEQGAWVPRVGKKADR